MRYSDNSGVYFGVTENDSKNAALTKDVIDKADVHVYIKFSTVANDQANGNYKLVERISNNAYSAHLKIPGRTTNTYDDFLMITPSYDAIGTDYFAPSLYLNTTSYDFELQKYVPIPDLIGKTAADFRAMVKDLPQFRMIIVPGAVKAGRLAAIDFNDYAAVQKALGLKD